MTTLCFFTTQDCQPWVSKKPVRKQTQLYFFSRNLLRSLAQAKGLHVQILPLSSWRA